MILASGYVYEMTLMRMITYLVGDTVGVKVTTIDREVLSTTFVVEVHA